MKTASQRPLLMCFAMAFALLAPFFLCRMARAQTETVAPTSKLRVLFIGNSYTYVNDLPAIIDQFFKARNTPFDYEAVTVGGATLEKQWNDMAALPAIRRGVPAWNFVILQEQSVRPFSNRDAFFRYARLFDYEIRHNGGARTTLYMTWNAKANPDEQPKLTDAYQTAGRELGAIVVPVGAAWTKATASGIPLYSSDGRHPNAQGSYLAACVFYRVLSGKSPVGLPLGFTRSGKLAAELTEAQALALQRIADSTPLP